MFAVSRSDGQASVSSLSQDILTVQRQGLQFVRGYPLRLPPPDAQRQEGPK